MTRSKLLLGTAILLTGSGLWAGAAWAQGADDQVESVSVSASRIQVQGYEAPTPVTVIGAADILRDARTDIGDEIRSLPEFGTSPSPNNSGRATYISDGSAGLNLVSLRNLGANRTLVLFNGQRVVQSNLAVPGTDISTIPSSLIERIDVVTGGASAAWGSDAVAGVVNLVLNTKLEGLKGNLEVGNNWNLSLANYKGELTYGTSFANGRGHVIVSGVYSTSPDTFFQNQIEGNKYARLVANPAYAAGNGQPALIHADYVGLVQATPGGIITSGPLKGIYFTGQNATPAVFNYGNVSSGYYTNGGTPNYGLSQSDFGEINNPNSSETLFGYASYDLTDDITASVQLNYGRSTLVGNSWTAVFYGTLTINQDNPFIPASVQQQMQTAGITSFPLGTTLTGDRAGIGNGGSVMSEVNALGMPVVQVVRQLYRSVASLDGKTTLFGKPWTWSTYYEHSEVHDLNNPLNNPQTQNIKNAVDAVRVTAANVGTSGLPVGSIACRSTLAAPTNGCVPLNVFGTGNDWSAASAYINGVARAGGDTSHMIIKENVASLSTSGELPVGLPAGNITSAAGFEYRHEDAVIRSTPAAIAGTFYVTGNTLPFAGAYDTKEGFLEFNAPILKDTFVQSLNIDAAGRYTDYSTSGGVETYKLGLVSQLDDYFRLRASFSHDIRAPGLYELFNQGQSIGTTAIDPHTGQGVSTFNITRGNPALKPENATTLTAGAVVTPDFLLPNLQLSADWWQIRIKDVITSANASTIIAQCVAGNQSFCNNLVFGGPNGALSQILVQPVNGAVQETSGVDMSADYHIPLLVGDLSTKFTGTYMYEDLQQALGLTYDAAGAIGEGNRTSIPKFKATLAMTYSQDNWQLTAQSRIIGAAKLNNAWTSLNVDDNDVPAIVYLDMRGSVDLLDHFQLYAAVDNVLDRRPPVVAQDSSAGGSEYASPYKDQIYDVFGRVWRMGLRISL